MNAEKKVKRLRKRIRIMQNDIEEWSNSWFNMLQRVNVLNEDIQILRSEMMQRRMESSK